METGATPNAAIISSVLGINVTQKDLNALLKIPSITFNDLSSHHIIIDLIRKASGATAKQNTPGIYIFKHLPTGSQYVGSSSQLVMRLRGYLLQTHKPIGKILPLLYSTPISE